MIKRPHLWILSSSWCKDVNTPCFFLYNYLFVQLCSHLVIYCASSSVSAAFHVSSYRTPSLLSRFLLFPVLLEWLLLRANTIKRQPRSCRLTLNSNTRILSLAPIVSCLCNMQNLVKGYISHKAKFLVMASTIDKAFPKICLVAWVDERSEIWYFV